MKRPRPYTLEKEKAEQVTIIIDHSISSVQLRFKLSKPRFINFYLEECNPPWLIGHYSNEPVYPIGGFSIFCDQTCMRNFRHERHNLKFDFHRFQTENNRVQWKRYAYQEEMTAILPVCFTIKESMLRYHYPDFQKTISLPANHSIVSTPTLSEEGEIVLLSCSERDDTNMLYVNRSTCVDSDNLRFVSTKELDCDMFDNLMKLGKEKRCYSLFGYLIIFIGNDNVFVFMDNALVLAKQTNGAFKMFLIEKSVIIIDTKLYNGWILQNDNTVQDFVLDANVKCNRVNTWVSGSEYGLVFFDSSEKTTLYRIKKTRQKS